MINLKKISVLVSFLLITLTSFTQGYKLGKVSSSKLNEISGITPYSYAPGYFWVHNDSGDKAQIYLIDSLANLIATVELDGIRVVDCEDIAGVTINEKSHLLLADIGNNLRNREIVNIYMFPEPDVNFSIPNIQIDNDKIKKVELKYTDKTRDAEAIFVDQQKQELFIVSKRDFNATVFSFPIKYFDESGVFVLKPKMTLPFTFVTAADMSRDGKFIIIKNLTNVFLWDRLEGENILQTLSKPFKNIPYQIEPQGEAICFDRDNRFFYTISERPFGLDSYLYKYIY